MHLAISRSPHTRKIVLHCLLVTTPMLASSLVILYIVYTNLTTSDCPSAELCPGPAFINTTSKAFYYVDFPAARLAFISSWSSTVSFALVGFLMAIAAYVNAAALLAASERGEEDELPSPHQMSLLLRVLNAELMVLWDLAVSKIKKVFWTREKNDLSVEPIKRTSPILGASIMIFLAGIILSLLVQAADVYFHIAAESVEFVQVQELPSVAHHYSRGLAPWCLDRPDQGPLGPKKFWGCAITAQAAPYNNATSIAPTNATIIQDLKNSVSDQHQILNFTDEGNVSYAVIAPANVGSDQDWKASSFAVSTTCSVITENACNVSDPITNASDGQGSPIMLVPFVCTKNRTGIDISGNLTSHNTKTHMLNFHKYASESPPFLATAMKTPTGLSPSEIMKSIQDDDANEVFSNPWQALVTRKIPFALQGDFENLPLSFRNDSRVWKHNLLGAFTLMFCNVTVWDVIYTTSGGQVTALIKSPSNGSTAGISSMSGTRFLGTLANVFQDASTGPESRSSPSAFISSFQLAISKAYSYPLASQMSSRPSLQAQVRTSKVITRLPVAALWFLVVANLGFAALGTTLAVWALMKAKPDVHQVHIRLGVSGLAAALFDREQFERSADADEKLFEETNIQGAAAVKRVGIVRTNTGGSSFAIYPLQGRIEEERAMQRRYFGSMIR
ncbi:hypothetical protein K458DRAFT_436235 [Lentithecium fluviatile CBS 122367]|uniref:Uncharacterized protein n=1 Tax=Lentithecium fluviatile CBS 122367 TaxID=1168545 RepID=A0A6G1IIM2_9PLEO|nr:hypothetical protein K458DRAFT_436235 [Lentithecium fluviatile CBS 122367]